MERVLELYHDLDAVFKATKQTSGDFRPSRASGMGKIFKLKYHENYCSVFSQISHNDKDLQVLFVHCF